jgi:hypothetical protein
VLHDAAAHELAIAGGDVRVGRLEIRTATATGATVSPATAESAPDATSGAPAQASEPSSEPSSAPAPEVAAPGEPARSAMVREGLGLLERVSGNIDVDLALDLTVPVLGRRRATHKFRIPIERGEIDYRKLENDLSTLENALLDFAIRDGGLVLEMGIPFIPTRGLGKPIVRWELGPEDLALAQQDRIRLVVLADGRLEGDGDGGEPSGRTSRVALRQLELQRLDVRLGLAEGEPPPTIPLRRIGTVALAGHLYHQPDAEVREGAIEGRLDDVELGAYELPIGPRVASIGGLRLVAAPELAIGFLGLRPRLARVGVEQLVIEQIRIK